MTDAERIAKLNSLLNRMTDDLDNLRNEVSDLTDDLVDFEWELMTSGQVNWPDHIKDKFYSMFREEAK